MTALLARPTAVVGLLGAADPATLVSALRRAEVAAAALAAAPELPASAHRTLDERVGGVLHRLLDIDLGELVVEGWGDGGELADAAARGRHGREVVEIAPADHRITSIHHPTVDVLAGGEAVTTLRFELAVSLRLRGVVALVGGGFLLDVSDGRVLAQADLGLDGRPVLAGTGRGPLAALLRLGDGLLLPGADPSAGPAPTSTAPTSTAPGSLLRLPRPADDGPT
jgi:hypothetical protein